MELPSKEMTRGTRKVERFNPNNFGAEETKQANEILQQDKHARNGLQTGNCNRTHKQLNPDRTGPRWWKHWESICKI